MGANISKHIRSDNAKCFTTVWKNTEYLHIDHKPTVTSSHSTNNALFTSVIVRNLYVWVSMGHKKLYVFIHDGHTESVLPLF